MKYSNCQVLENDLHVLAAACKHTIPKRDDLDDMIRKKKGDCNVHITSKWSPCTDLPQKSTPSRYTCIPCVQRKSMPPSRRDTRKKEKGAQWRQSLTSKEKRYLSADSLISPMVPLSSPSPRFPLTLCLHIMTNPLLTSAAHKQALPLTINKEDTMEVLHGQFTEV